MIHVSDSSKSAVFIVSKSSNISNLFSKGEYLCFWNPLVTVQNFEIVLECAEDSILFVVKGESNTLEKFSRNLVKSLDDGTTVCLYGRIVFLTNLVGLV